MSAYIRTLKDHTFSRLRSWKGTKRQREMKKGDECWNSEMREVHGECFGGVLYLIFILFLLNAISLIVINAGPILPDLLTLIKMTMGPSS